LNRELNRRDSAPGSLPVVVALGSNLGDSAATLIAAMTALEHLAIGPLRRSSLWRSAPVDCPPGSPDFVNAVVVFEPVSGETPESLLQKLRKLERDFGRERSGEANQARTLDLDLIAFGQESRAAADLDLPHPRAQTRRFVLAPLVEILPDFQAPGWPANARGLLEGLEGGEVTPLRP
jgi:2-amino-4-hydroxy-6-hydroxymethyldihydropteridine diphosphokinase